MQILRIFVEHWRHFGFIIIDKQTISNKNNAIHLIHTVITIIMYKMEFIGSFKFH